MERPRIIVLESGSGIEIISDIDLDVTFLDGFTDGIDDLVVIDDDEWQLSSNFEVNVDKDRVDDILRQLDEE